ncbi:hypothetical protein [Metabacillus sp. FJAT-53654]|uniref:Uncharacterized protein n=1 Tax=Metabacillus rhizosphaerae TaxID=3117747 RepID=A0ABZ2MZV0_9BACI
MSAQSKSERVFNEEMSLEKVKETLMEIMLILTKNQRSKEEQFEEIEQIYLNRIFNKHIV